MNLVMGVSCSCRVFNGGSREIPANRYLRLSANIRLASMVVQLHLSMSRNRLSTGGILPPLKRAKFVAPQKPPIRSKRHSGQRLVQLLHLDTWILSREVI